MNNKIFGAFLERLTESINSEMGDPNGFRNEYIDLLYELSDQLFNPVDLLRKLGHFRIELAHLKSTIFAEKKLYLKYYKAI